MSTATRTHRVAVVGGGLTGLLAARRLVLAGRDVVVYEADDRLGGQIHTVEIAGRPVDLGAEAVHLLSPAGRALIDELGLAERVAGSVPGASLVATPAGPRPLPAGVGPAGPTRLGPVLRGRVLDPLAAARAALEPVAARLAPALRVGRDVSVGEFTSARFGRQVTTRLVDPLLGGLHSGDVDRLSLRACVPSLVPAAQTRRSLLRGRSAPTTTRPVTPAADGRPPVTFATFPDGLSTLIRRIADDVPSRVHTGVRVDALERTDDGRYRLHLTGAGVEHDVVDDVVLAVPAYAAAPLLAPMSEAAARPLRETTYATTAAVVVAFRRTDVEHVAALRGTGLLVPTELGGTLKAATHLSTKWPHLHRDDDLYLLRLSAGRAGADVVTGVDDDTLVTRLLTDLADRTGLRADPVHVHVRRWAPGLPQLTVGHLDRLAAGRAALAAEAPGTHLAGASYDGIGLTSCMTSADAAAAAVLRRTAGPAGRLRPTG